MTTSGVGARGDSCRVISAGVPLHWVPDPPGVEWLGSTPAEGASPAGACYLVRAFLGTSSNELEAPVSLQQAKEADEPKWEKRRDGISKKDICRTLTGRRTWS